MVYIADNSLLITCNCNCGNAIEFKVLDEYVFISILQSCFNFKQQKILYLDDLKKAFNLLIKRKVYLSEICLREENKYEFIKGLKSLNILPNGDSYKNTSSIKLSKENDSNDFSVYIQSNELIMDVLSGKSYQAYDIILTKEELDIFIKKCEKYLK